MPDQSLLTSDVPTDHFARPFIDAVFTAGITTGCDAGPPLLYCPQGDVTRAEMAIFLIRALEETPVASPTGIFSDVTAGHFAEGHIEHVFELGITTGISGSRIQVGLSL